MGNAPNPDLQGQIDELVAAVRANRLRIDELEARSALDRVMIAELQADGTVSRENVAQLEAALVASRVIGAAVGILMASRDVGQDEAFAILRAASSRNNVKLRDLAETLVNGADATASSLRLGKDASP